VILSILLALLFPIVSAQNETGTEVGGILEENTTWTIENSPYTITDTIQIPEDVTLIIEPGVTIGKLSSGDMFLILGTIYAHGTSNNKIIFDGGGNSQFFDSYQGKGNFSYCIIRNGYDFWHSTINRDRFDLTYSELTNLIGGTCVIHIECPLSDVHIKYNRFINTAGISLYQACGYVNKLYLEYNLFYNMASPILHHGGTPGLTEMIVKYNSFIDIEETILKLGEMPNAVIHATENYWGSSSTEIIDSKIYDRNDDIRIENYIDYLPILTAPHPDTPTYPESTNQTFVSGYLGENTTWTYENSPYILTDDVVLEPGVSLFIEPGVTVKFTNGTSLVIDGTIIAEGNSTHKILCTSNSITPVPGDWETILLRNQTVDSKISWWTVEHGTNGLTLDGGSLMVENCDISNNSKCGIVFSSTHIVANISSSLFSNNGEDGIHIPGSGKHYIAVNIADCSIVKNGMNGIFANHGCSVAVNNSTISDNSYHGIQKVYSTLIVDQCEIENNGLDGVNSKGDYLNELVVIANSNVSFNNNIGINLWHGGGNPGGGEPVTLFANTITFNQVGVALRGPTSELQETQNVLYNNIFGNFLYNFQNLGSFDINATNIWWGTTNDAEISQHIYDYYDDYELGKIVYDPFLTETILVPEFSPYMFNISVESQSYNITAVSNSTLSEFSFNQTSKEVRFNVEGLPGTTGLCNVTIPNSLMYGTFSVFMDDVLLVKDVDYLESYNGTHYLFQIFYNHSIHTISIISSEVIQEFTSWIILTILLVVSLLGVIIRKKFRVF
jgi:hypothetical protein